MSGGTSSLAVKFWVPIISSISVTKSKRALLTGSSAKGKSSLRLETSAVVVVVSWPLLRRQWTSLAESPMPNRTDRNGFGAVDGQPARPPKTYSPLFHPLYPQ